MHKLVRPHGVRWTALAALCAAALYPPAVATVYNGFPTGNVATVNSSADKFRLDDTAAMQADRSPRSVRQSPCMAAVYDYPPRLVRIGTDAAVFVEPRAVNDSLVAANGLNRSEINHLRHHAVVVAVSNFTARWFSLVRTRAVLAFRAAFVHTA